MLHRFAAVLLLAACSVERVENPDMWEGDDDDSSWIQPEEETPNEAGDPEPLVPTLGLWSVSNAVAISDKCGVGNHQEVTEMVPSEFTIEEKHALSFRTGDGVDCILNSFGEFVCEADYLEESAMPGAALMIETIMKGRLLTPTTMNLHFDVVIQGCEGPGCLFIELALPFPCPVILEAFGAQQR